MCVYLCECERERDRGLVRERGRGRGRYGTCCQSSLKGKVVIICKTLRCHQHKGKNKRSCLSLRPSITLAFLCTSLSMHLFLRYVCLHVFSVCVLSLVIVMWQPYSLHWSSHNMWDLSFCLEGFVNYYKEPIHLIHSIFTFFKESVL